MKWDAAKIRAYFDECRVHYERFLSMSDSLMKAFLDFVNDDTHTGEEADNSKAFVRERQITLLIDITDDIQQLEEFQEEIMAAFAAEVDNLPTAIIKTGYLDKVTLDFGAYEDALKEIGEEIESIAEELNATCSEVGRFMVPDYRDYFNAMETLVSNDGMSGIVPETKKKLEAFDANHANDVSISLYQTLYDTIMANIESFINGVGNGTSYDIRTYNGSKFDIKWENPLDHLSEAARNDYGCF